MNDISRGLKRGRLVFAHASSGSSRAYLMSAATRSSFADEPGGGVDGGSPGGLLGIGVANSRILRVVRRFDGIRVDVLVGSVLAALLLVV